MKKVLALITALLPMLACAQYFELTPDGFVNAQDTTKRFVVIQMDGSQEELYNKAKTAITTMWNSPKDVMSYNEPDVIVVNGFTNDLYVKNFGIKSYLGMHYRLQFHFKDGKIRIDAPSADKAESGNGKGVLYFCRGGGQSMLGIIYVFDKKGKLKQKDFKAQVENYFDTLITALIEKMKSGGSIEDW